MSMLRATRYVALRAPALVSYSHTYSLSRRFIIRHQVPNTRRVRDSWLRSILSDAKFDKHSPLFFPSSI